ncbi:hypothetical protein KJ809_01550 [Patescibacteria group bacterium]|nr:hypothetical protein [Patescibacteria group bacterium]
MPDNFQQTVNLKEKAEQQKKELQQSSLNQIKYAHSKELEDDIREKLQKIDRPIKSEAKLNSRLIQLVVFILAFLIIGFTIYSVVFKNSDIFKKTSKSQSWYAVKLTNNETFYGQIKDIKADPIVMDNVYYNYDQDKKDDKKEIAETTNLRLVKRGKETHGPVGTMDLVRSQVLFMEPLKNDSNVLKAILEYEK